MNVEINQKIISNERLQSLDILRGFDMFWIIGGGSLIISLSQTEGLKWLAPIANQMKHVDWIGFTFWDLIFPLFMFIAGVTIPYAILSRVEKGVKKKSLQLKIFKRASILIILGILYNGILQKGFSDIRYTSVLGQIGIAYLIGASIVLQTKSIKSQQLWLLFIVLVISSLHLFIPVPGYGAGHFDPVRIMNAWVDQNFLPGTLSSETYDRLGIICIVSASFLVLAGSFAGRILRTDQLSKHKKALFLTCAGALFILFALVLSPMYPISKVIWTMTFNFLTLGISLILLAAFYYTIDVIKIKSKALSVIGLFFKVIGLNSITIYMTVRIIPFRDVSKFFTGSLAASVGIWIIIAGAILLEWLLLYYLYKQKIFLKV
jgi:predicted acyltransferase